MATRLSPIGTPLAIGAVVLAVAGAGLWLLIRADEPMTGSATAAS